jgi:transcriptional regulator with XRE-family HTH domain
MRRRLRTARLRELREAKNWNWSDLARQLKIEVSTPPKWERGQTQPRQQMLEKLADLFDVTVEDLTEEVKSNS